MQPRHARPRRPGWGLAAGLVAAAVVLLAGVGLLAADGADGPGGFSLPGVGDSTPEPSGWAAAAPATLPEGTVLDVGGTSGEVALATLAAVVDQAPVVVVTAAATGPAFDAAAGLAEDLHAPIVVVDDTGEPAAGSATDAADDDDTGEPAAAGSAAATTASGGTPEAADQPDDAVTRAGPVDGAAALLADWATEQVVAVGDVPALGLDDVEVHEVGVALATPSAATADGDGASASDATASATPAADDESAGADLVLPDEVLALRTDAAAATADPGPAPLVVARGDEADRQDAARGAVALRADVVATLATFGTPPVAWTQDDPRRDDDLREGLAGPVAAGAGWVVAVAEEHRPAPSDADWAGRVRNAAVAPELPGGGQVLFPDRVFVATYGNPSGPALGVLGERDVDGSIEFVQGLVDDYEGLFGEDVPIQPAFEIIVTIASGSPEPTGDYSRREDLDLVTEWVDAATEAGLYVVLDLQPGRTDFLTQAREIEELLLRPNVGLALDPEWRLAPDEVHLRQIGTVTTAEVNEVSAWLAQLVRDHDLPQKLLIVHNFRLAMLTEREDLVDHWELAEMVHVDGQGAQPDKDATYEVITEAGPDFLWWGWKNFYDEDVPGIRSPEDTAMVEPQPNFISYQ